MLRTLAKDLHVHVWAAGSDDERRHLVFRDRLRTNEGDRREYERTKRMLAGHWREMNHYARAKGEVIERIMRRVEASVDDDQALIVTDGFTANTAHARLRLLISAPLPHTEMRSVDPPAGLRQEYEAWS